MDWSRFLAIARCPLCRAPLTRDQNDVCCSGAHRFAINAIGIPLFAPPVPGRTPSEQRNDEDQAAAYAGLRAFAATAIGRGESEGLYRTVSDLTIRALGGQNVTTILDLGCGAGRTLVDCATAFPGALVVGADLSEAALTVAYAVSTLRGPAVTVDLRRWGFGYRQIEANNLSNVFLVQADAQRLPFRAGDGWPGFDAVTSVNLLDRVRSADVMLQQAAAVLRQGGSLILTTPLNWRKADGTWWERFGDLDGLCGLVQSTGFVVDLAFDGLVYREIHDVRGSVSDWRVAVVQAHSA